MISESPTTSVAGQGTEQLANVAKRQAVRKASPLRVVGIFVFELFTVHSHGLKRSSIKA